MFLVGRFKREYFTSFDTNNPMNEVKVTDNVTRDHLVNAASDEDYQVINLSSMEYFDPKQNKWLKIESI